MNDLPLLASVPTETFTTPAPESGWYVEPKYDGHRVIVDYRGNVPRFLNRNGQTYGAGPFRVEIPDSWKGAVVDGEYMPQTQHYIVIDALKHPNDKHLQYEREYSLRRLLAEQLVAAQDSIQILAVTSNPVSLVEVEHWRGFDFIDGVVFKKPRSVYVPGRSDSWLKYKFTSDIDCAVTALNIDGKSNCELSVWDPLSETSFAIGKASTNGKDKIDVGAVVTVRFLKFTGKRLREPRIVDVRDDKTTHDCTIEQLIPFVPHLAEQLD